MSRKFAVFLRREVKHLAHSGRDRCWPQCPFVGATRTALLAAAERIESITKKLDATIATSGVAPG